MWPPKVSRCAGRYHRHHDCSETCPDVGRSREACGYSVRTLKQAVYDGNLMARYANSKGVIRVEDLSQWLDNLPAEPPAGRS